jgi:hypothetical protein
MSISHGVPSFVCATSKAHAGQGISAFIDAWGRVVLQQTGGETFVYKGAIDYPGDGEARHRGSWEMLGAVGVLGCWTLTIVLVYGGIAVRNGTVPSLPQTLAMVELVQTVVDSTARWRHRWNRARGGERRGRAAV